MVFTYNLYLRIGYSRVCLHITSFVWIQCSAACSKSKFCFFGTFWDFLKNIFYLWLVGSRFESSRYRRLTVYMSSNLVTNTSFTIGCTSFHSQIFECSSCFTCLKHFVFVFSTLPLDKYAEVWHCG